jgi:multidrug efflux pump subunit AcrA (membrane-fusion protein)
MKLKSYTMLQRAPNPIKILWIVGSAFILATLFFLFVPWQQNAVGNGRVIAFSPTERQHTINSPITGRIKQWFIEEGQTVKKGDPIVEISDMDPELTKRLQMEKAAILTRITGSEQALKAAESNVNRQKALYEQGISSKRQYELAQIEKSKYLNELAQMNIDKLDI